MTESAQPVAEQSANITALLKRFSEGDQRASSELFEAVMSELKRIAGARLRGERNCPLQPTELVNLAYLKLADRKERIWNDRQHFFNFSSKVMYHVLVDLARQADAIKRPGKWASIPLDNDATLMECDADEILDVSRSLERLRAVDARIGAIVEHRFYGGLTNSEIAESLGVCTKTVTRDLEFARAWLKRDLHRNKA